MASSSTPDEPLVTVDSAAPNQSPVDEALDSNQVIELQAFSERKTWIEDKIKFLEKMPPIEVFVGLDALKSSAEVVPGLPSRSELQQWIVEHDAIEKETEIFDTGELKKLRAFTRAATQRNLSPEDTDLIELTLTTIYELDKLLHLLRDRSENLDLLGIRLGWEEHRSASWKERREIVADLQKFLEQHGRWSVSVYGSPNQPDSDTSLDLSSPSFSRSTRFKLAELLSKDAAHFSTRVTTLKHSHISAAGKVLDKLIDNSRKPVPEELLDEQDRLEERGIAEMEHVGKFVMNIVMQWRKADEIYVETLKDQVGAAALVKELEAANLQQPTSRQSVSFVSRAETLSKRLLLRGNPISAAVSFPRPIHPLFADQEASNNSLKAEIAAREYQKNSEAVSNVEHLMNDAETLSKAMTSIIDRLENGVLSSAGDGAPPDLTSKACLDSTRHSVFLALLPALKAECDSAEEKTTQILRHSNPAMLRLAFPGLDPNFKTEAAATFARLSAFRRQMQQVKGDVTARVGRLQESRRIWAAMNERLEDMENIRREIGKQMESSRWRHSTHWDDASPSAAQGCRAQRPWKAPLRSHLSHSAVGLKDLLDQLHQMAKLLESVHAQSTTITSIFENFNALQSRVEEVKLRFDSCVQRTLDGQLSGEELSKTGSEIANQSAVVRSDVTIFIEKLSEKVPFIAKQTSRVFVKRAFSSVDLKLGFSENQPIEIPFDLQRLDDDVRTTANSISMRLNGTVHALKQQERHFELARLAKDVDYALSLTIDGIDQITEQFSSVSSTFAAAETDDTLLPSLDGMLQQLDHISTEKYSTTSQSFSPIRALLQQIHDNSGVSDPAVHSVLYLARARATDDAELKLKQCKEDIQSLRDQILVSRTVEVERLETMRLAELHRLEEERKRQLEEEARIAAEEAERVRLEMLRIEEENRIRLEREKAAEESRLEAERQRQEAEAAEEARIQRGEEEEAQRKQLEEQRLAEERFQLAEKQRLALEEAERARLHREKSEMEVKLRLAEQQLAEQRRLQAEKDRAAAAAENARTARLKEEWAAEQAKIKNVRSTLGNGYSDAEDVFGSPMAETTNTAETRALHSQIIKLRRRLSHLELAEVALGSSAIPSQDQAQRLRVDFSAITMELDDLPTSSDDLGLNSELQSLRREVESLAPHLAHIERLGKFAHHIELCDNLLSDLLEHIDSYPAVPLGPLAASYQTPANLTAGAQLSERLTFTKSAIDELTSAWKSVQDDRRTVVERDRVLQTWQELDDMANDRITGKRSRSNSVMSSAASSGRNSSASVSSVVRKSKVGGYANLSVGSSTPRSRMTTSSPAPRRVVSSNQPPERSSTSARMYNRSTSGPLGFSLYGTTFASRQRTTSLTPSSPSATPVRKTSGPLLLPRTQYRSSSPSISDASSHSRSVSNGHSNSRSSNSISTWSRAPRMSFPTISRSPPQKRPPRKNYVANPKNKLDVAVGDVVNSLPVGINIESVSGSWKDQSGKYWIGDQDPKLCFCRILRSQTVMVRVGGGWQELSKFIRGHLADSFRLLESPPSQSIPREEKWISSSTLLEAAEITDTTNLPPRTPEPKVPSFSISSPAGSPHSIKSSPSTKGSPLTALQFMRRAEPDAPFLRPETPSQSPLRARNAPMHTPSRNSVWRP
ncbi:hypothetical protein C8J56DRAFT_1047538 [Mycena floridula]|nr:hypothetical protein C8J56DRAFT_1047538 [Mycena floridula]